MVDNAAQNKLRVVLSTRYRDLSGRWSFFFIFIFIFFILILGKKVQ